MRRARSVVGVVLLGGASALAQPARVRVVARAPGEAVFSTAPAQARVGEPVTLAAVVLDDRGGARGVDGLVRVGRRVLRATPFAPGTRVRWLRVLPRMEHVDAPPPNPGVPTFSNAALFGPRHGRWLGFDRLEYETRALRPGDPATPAGDAITLRAAGERGAGSAWFSAEVEAPDGSAARAPDGSAVDRLGLSREVARVSFRDDDTYLGWLSTYFGVANVFGSNGAGGDHQTDRYTGADCADVLVGALRASGRRVPRYLSVAEIGEAARRVAGPLRIDADGRARDLSGAPVALRWGADLAPGDLLTLGYLDDPAGELPRDWDHIGALVRDDGDGVLSGGDTLRHMGGRGLVDTPVLHGGALRVAVWRWRAAR